MLHIAAMASRPWVDHSMSYFKIRVAKDAIYRIDQNSLGNTLAASGFNIQSIDSTKWAIFHRGKEMAIHYESGDIYFFGQKNDASLDTGLYFEGGLVNPYINMFSDTSAYFLSWYTDSRNGKRINSINTTNPVTANYHFASSEWKPDEYQYFIGQNYNVDDNARLFMASFQPGEGWTGAAYSNTFQITVDSIQNLYTSGPSPYLKLYLLAESKSSNAVTVSLGNTSPRNWKVNQVKVQAGPLSFSDEITNTDIEMGQLQINSIINSGEFSPVHAELFYPQNIAMDGLLSKVFIIDSGFSDETQIVIDDLSINSSSEVLTFDISDPYNIRQCEKSYNSTTGELSLSVDSCNLVKRKVLVLLKSQSKTITDIQYRIFQDLSSPDQDLLLVYPDKFDSAAQAYYDYRISAAGGAYNPLKIEIEEVYDQFSFGEYTPLGIREMCRYMHNNSSANSNYLFLMAKGLFFTQKIRINNIVYTYRFNPEVFDYKNLVPTFGYPGGDWPFVMNFNIQKPNEIAFGVGRIASRTQEQVFDYLDKIKEFEDPLNNGLWRKRILHMSGGVTESEIQNFYNYVNQFKNIAEGKYLGGKVQTISKTEPAGVQNIFIDTVINKGISLLTMYGHSSVQFNDIEIGDVNDPNLNYNNGNGQYPMFIINGCETGRIFERFESWAQNWINEPGKGASLMLAHAFDGFDPILKFYTEHIYRTAFSDSLYFGKPIGDILTKACNNFNDQYSIFYGRYIQSQLELMTLQGDPVLRISAGIGNADYAINQSDIKARSFDGSDITTNTDSFQLIIPIENYGRLTEGLVGVLVERINPVNTLYDTVYINSFGYSDTVYYTIYNTPDNLLLGGLNEFRISVDPGALIPEDNEVNNIAAFSILLPVQYVRNISPTNFGIVSNNSIRLVASAQLPADISSITYQFEIDTSYLFDSQQKITFQYQSGNTGIWDIDLQIPNISDTLVFYWRSKKLEDTIWSESSFTYINNSPSGWSQSAYGQYLKNNFEGGLELNSNTQRFEFLDFSTDLELRFSGRNAPFNDTTLIKIGNALLRKNSNLEARPCANNRMLLVKISGQTGQAYRDLSAWDFRNCGIQPFGIRQFPNGTIATDSISTSLLNYINSVESDDYILMMAHGLVNFNTMSPALRDTLASFGLDPAMWDDMVREEPFFYLGRRNWPGSFYIRGDTALATPLDEQIIDLNYTLTETYRSGAMKSVKIGPAKSWTSINFSLTAESNDLSRTDLFGLMPNGVESLIYSDLSQGQTLLTDIDAGIFPMIVLKTYFEDSLDRTSAQLDNWTVIYEGTAEGLIDPTAFGPDYYNNISIQEGDTLKLQFSFKNISEFDFSDSVLVRFSVNENINSEKWINAPKSNDSTVFEYELITTDLNGDFSLRTFVNPFIQSELYYDNNIMETDFSVFRDISPPFISATFDGVRIQNNDVVSYNTDIKITLSDENPFLNISDSNAIFFELYKTENFLDSLINISADEIFRKIQTDTNDFQLFILPDSLHDGNYRLEFNGRDASGNLAGPFPKIVEFQVQSAIPSQYNQVSIFPNPFQSSLFVTFDLNGKNRPDMFEVGIFDLNGKNVYRNNLADLVKLGDNRIEFWNGKNYENQRLSSGMYIYRIQIEGQDLENLSSQPIIGKVLFNP